MNQHTKKLERQMTLTRSSAVGFIVLAGAVSLFADMNYEGGRGVAGQYLQLLGSSAFAIGLAAGIGEFIGYGFRFISGALADRTKKYWTFIIIGYTVQLCSLPSMAFFSGWELAVILLFFERLGKAIRKPAHDALISFASKQTGSGFGFGLHEAMDQIGAFLGPALFSILLFTTPDGADLGIYRNGLLLLFIPAALAIGLSIAARWKFPHPQRFEVPSKTPQFAGKGFPRVYWLLITAAGLLAAGITDFPLIGLHLRATGLVPEAAIPLLYAGAMAIDAAAALIFGRIYDRLGIKTLLVLFGVEILTAPLVFSGDPVLLIVGIALWGISVGTQETILKAAIGDLIPENKRATAFGVFNTIFGVFWLGGSAIIGLLYDHVGVLAMVLFSVVVQAAALVLFLRILTQPKAPVEVPGQTN